MSTSAGIGKVFLVGAGPGDPGLLTLRGAALLGRCDVVVYDYLANPLLLNHCPQAERIYVGKKASEHTLTQDEINTVLVRLGKEGKIVVRLKGGDPFIFGRGGEECLALFEAGIPFETVPGITAAIAAPAYAGIPVTHRDFNSSFTFITGHEKEDDYKAAEALNREPGQGSSDLDWSVVAKLPTFAFYMGVKSLPRICAKLIEHGMPADTPAATIRWGTTPQQRTIVGTLTDLPGKIEAAGLKPPAITIVGKVVTLRDSMNWFENRPLFGRRIIVTRTRQQASDLSNRLSELGAFVLEAPTIDLEEVTDKTAIDAALATAGGFDWIVFTSANGVSYTRRRLDELGLDSRAFGKAKIAAIGEATAQAIRTELALRVDCCPEKFVAEALSDELIARGEAGGGRFLLLRADIARPVLVERLNAAGAAEVRDVSIYQTKRATSLPPELLEALAAKEVDWITFTSSSTARNFTELLGDNYREQLQGIKIASIGPITTQTLKDLGLEPNVEAAQHDIPNLAAAISDAGM